MTSLCITDQETQKENVLGGPTPLWVSIYTSYLLYKVQDHSAYTDSPMAKIVFFSIFNRGPVFASQTKKLRKRMCLLDQLPCGSVLTPAISCTKLKIHSVYKDSPMAKIVFFSIFNRGPVFASQTKKLRKTMCLVDQLPCGSVLTPAISCTKFKIHSAYKDSPMAKIVFYIFNRGPVFASQTKKLRKRMCLVDQLPCGSVLTPAISCTKFKIHSACKDSPMAKIVFFSIFNRGPVFASRNK